MLSERSEELLGRLVGRSVYMWFWRRGARTDAPISGEGCCWSQNTLISARDFSAFLRREDARNWVVSGWGWVSIKGAGV